MKVDISDLRPTIIPRSDQINAEQLLSGPMTITVTDVRIGTDEQPVVIHYENDAGRPYKPSKTMRKVLILAWGADGREWVGKSMTLFHDPTVKFGGAEVGGIRISHLTDIPRDIHVSLTATKGKKAPHVIKWMATPQAEKPVEHDLEIVAAETVEACKAAFGAAYKSTKDADKRAEYKRLYDRRMTELVPVGDDEKRAELGA